MLHTADQWHRFLPMSTHPSFTSQGVMGTKTSNRLCSENMQSAAYRQHILTETLFKRAAQSHGASDQAPAKRFSDEESSVFSPMKPQCGHVEGAENCYDLMLPWQNKTKANLAVCV